jgi:hypothetical protein
MKIYPLAGIDTVRTRCVHVRVLFRMLVKPHLTDETGEPINTRHCGVDRLYDQVVAGKWVSYLF